MPEATDHTRASREYLARLIQPRLEAVLAELPAVMLVGPRAAGKTTTAERYAATSLRLDRESEAVAFRADPDAALRGLKEPILLDEWQAVPGVLGAVKRFVDQEPRPGRFILTGSVRADLQADTWPGTGRVVRLPLYGLTVREIRGAVSQPSLLARIADNGPEVALAQVPDAPDLRGYLELALQSGFPEPALRLSSSVQREWIDGYLDQLLTRDVQLIDAGRDPERLRRFLLACCAVTAQVVDEQTLLDASGLNRKTATAYGQLLKNLFVVDWVPAWSSNRLKQLTRGPKRYFLDAGLAAGVLRLDVNAILRNGKWLGPILDTFVTAQIRAELTGSALGPQLHHLRTQGGRHEVDLLLKVATDQVVGVEIKATSAPTPADTVHLRWLQETLGPRFRAGILFHTGPRSFVVGRDIIAIPIAMLWSPCA